MTQFGLSAVKTEDLSKMEPLFCVFVRDESGLPHKGEIKVAEFLSYIDAKRLRQELGRLGRCCVIRATGETGGSG